MFSMVDPSYRPSVKRNWTERILNSATGLAKDVFNGPASGIDMRYGLADKGTSQAQASRTVASEAIPRRRRSGAVLACDFRRLREAEEEARRELEFKRFAESGVGSWKESEGEGMCGGYAEMQMRGEELERTASQEQRQQDSLETFETSWPINPISPPVAQMYGRPSSYQHHSTTHIAPKNDLWQNIDEVEAIWTRSKSAAISRLQQVRDHLSSQSPRISRRHILRPIQPLPEDRESFKALLKTLQVQPAKADADNLDITYFHCPHVECHRRLERQNANLQVEFETRVCVHTGCGFVSRSVEEWVVHCIGEHHVEETSEGQSTGSCERCRTVEDTHV